jgi:ABC-type multidrug transport system ATPase subunit
VEKRHGRKTAEGESTLECVRGSAIQCRDLRKTYDGKVEAVRGLNLEIQTGECFGLLGPNEAGKTTTIEILEGAGTHFRRRVDSGSQLA